MMEITGRDNNSDSDNLAGPSPRQENSDEVEIPLTNTHVIIDPNHVCERENSTQVIYKRDTDPVKVVEIIQDTGIITEELKMTFSETEDTQCAGDITQTIKVQRNITVEEDIAVQAVSNLHLQEDTSHQCSNSGNELSSETMRDSNGRERVQNTETVSRDPIQGSKSEYSEILPSIGGLPDAPLTYVDEDDGLLKILGRVCGVSKKKLLDEDYEPYSKQVGKSFSPDQHKLVQIIDKIQTETSESQRRTLNSPVGDSSRTDQPSTHMMAADTGPRVARPDFYSGKTNVKDLTKRPNVQPVLVGQASTQNVQQHVGEDEYDCTHGMRGYMLCIVNEIFDRQSPRAGAHWDLIKMREIGRKFGFRLLNYNQEKNLTKNETLGFLKQAQMTDHSDCDCFMFMISTHGLEQRNASKGGQLDHALICKDEQLIFTSNILDMFNDDNCPSLRGKPKIFYIQACRGEELDSGGKILVSRPVTKDEVDISSYGGTGQVAETSDTSDTRCSENTWTNMLEEPVRSERQSQLFGIQQQTRLTHPAYQYQQQQQQQHPQYQTVATAQFHSYQCTDMHMLHSQSSRGIPSVPGHLVNKTYAPSPYAIVEAPSLKCDNDMLVMFAIPPGKFAWRNTSEGSWMIDYLHKVLMAYDMRRPQSFLSLMTKVTALMSRRTTHTPSAPAMHEKKAVSVIEHKLIKDIMVRQKAPVSDWIK